ncbi:sulfatase-like hydrolase/transferase [Mechercharimyces sp. CAU 1602]|uniref:sulfatase-like hydrolase/transferase n=1 Tax=Mechercharimyces sp. CAU 1602 TaxID=2973933 RepID=UPI002162EBC5|nr:sulfatase-like hydrolase/transferase [Mechercharimyces sp. CAU 1602]MCS1351089.1 sulfatase-like hydrolase/transferase [Mechercharimyces sp. CAU 1602]
MKHLRRPNFLLFIVDQERYPTVYETEKLRQWRTQYLKTQTLLKQNGFEFHRHYAASTACCPSRASLFTGQYPSLHGVSQTPGAAKSRFEKDMFWLDPNTVPTIGDYFRQAGYQTYYKGKWHISQADILIPGTRDAWLTYEERTGVPIPEKEHVYLEADRLFDYGFSGWIGPEPSGENAHNSGSSAAVGVSGRDVVYADESVSLIHSLEQQANEDQPWFLVSSFVNPHDIAYYGLYSRLSPDWRFTVLPEVPYVPPAPTAYETLERKPSAQRSYRALYPYAVQPLQDDLHYRRLYYSLQEEADQNMMKVFQALQQSRFYDNTIVIFTSDHGELLGAHGGLFQKFYQAYEESIHVPLIIHHPSIPKNRGTDTLTSHVDLLPTMLSLAGLDEEELRSQLMNDHTEARPLVGRSLTPILREERSCQEEPIYFMTNDDLFKGEQQVSALGIPYQAVVQPNNIETVIVRLQTGVGGAMELWKYSCYSDDPKFWNSPNQYDQMTIPQLPPGREVCTNICQYVKRQPLPSQYEMYNLSCDPLEIQNLALDPRCQYIQTVLATILRQERTKKRLSPQTQTQVY